MKINRKSFLKALAFAGGGTMGLMTSPAPWHLTRDLARWTQNWPWVPAPAQGKPSQVNSICGMCSGGCGIIVRKVDERMVRVEGNKRHPVNRGFICPIGISSLQMVYGPARVRQPLRRAGSRGEGKWEELSWEEAIAEFADSIKKRRSAAQSHAIACFTNSADGTTNELLDRFLKAIGSRNLVKLDSGKDARAALMKVMQGIDALPAYDFEGADFLLSFGCSLLEGWGTCGRMYGAVDSWYRERARPVELVQIESNFSTTASKAAKWIPIAPGTEAALAMGIAHVMISEGSYDQAFVSKHCFGFEDWKDDAGKMHRGFKSLVLGEYSPPAVEKITGVSVKDIEMLGHRFAVSEHPLAVGGGGRGDHFNGIYELMAIHSLNALAGNINKTGGVLVKSSVPLNPLPDVLMDEEAARGYAAGALDGTGKGSSLAAALPGVNDAALQLLIVHESNPLYSLPEQQLAARLFEKIPYIVSLSSYMDESAAHADLVLPLSTRLERWDDQLAAPELQYAVYNLNRPVVAPLYTTRSAGDIVIETAKKLGGTIAESFRWANMQEVLRERAHGLFESGRGVIDSPDLHAIEGDAQFGEPSYSSFSEMWDKLQQQNCWFDTAYNYGDLRNILKTPSGKFEFYSRTLQSMFGIEDDEKYMPHYEKPDNQPKGFDVAIMTEDMLLMGDDGKGTPPFLMKQLDENVLKENDLFVQINPITAMYHDLAEGDRVVLESPAAKVHVRLHLYEGVREGVVLIRLGFGHTAFDKFLRGKGVNAKRLLVVKKDSITGLPLWRITPGKIVKT